METIALLSTTARIYWIELNFKIVLSTIKIQYNFSCVSVKQRQKKRETKIFSHHLILWLSFDRKIRKSRENWKPKWKQ